ncbi:hypothetical protein AB0K08_16180 [Citricoccus sp. NPDC055426]|uniref:hypothetical protein n=1 Tax=Citricoccus sp. NPDC055426 TaxID=3155536 RepID=UPI003446CEF0
MNDSPLLHVARVQVQAAGLMDFGAAGRLLPTPTNFLYASLADEAAQIEAIGTPTAAQA